MSNPQSIQTPRSNDILLGRGAGNYNHHGNVVFRLVVEQNKALYSKCTNAYKAAFARAILETVWRQDPAGRFLEKSKSGDGLWYEVDSKVALKKAQQWLREPNRKQAAAAAAGGGASAAAGPQHSEKHLADTERLLRDMSARVSVAMKDVASRVGSSSSSFDRTKVDSTSNHGKSAYSGLGGDCSTQCAAGGGFSSSAPHFDDTYAISPKDEEGMDFAPEPIPLQSRCWLEATRNTTGTPKSGGNDRGFVPHTQQQGSSTNIGVATIPATQRQDAVPPSPAAVQTELQTTQSDAANMVTLLRRISTVSFAFANENARRLSAASLLGHDDMLPIPMNSTQTCASEGQEQQGQCQTARRISQDLMDDFDDSPQEANIRALA